MTIETDFAAVDLATSVRAGESERHHIFVVNNNPDFLELLQELLNDEGYRVTIERYSMQVQTHIIESRPDVVILDISPGTEQGFQLIADLRGDSAARDIPVIVASTQRVLAERAMRDELTPVVDVLPKPFDIHDLYDKLTKIINR